MQQIEETRSMRTVSDVDTKAKELMQGGAKDIESAKYGLGKVGKTLVDVGSAAASLAGDIALAASTGISALAPMALRSFGGAAYQAEQAGATVGQQLLYGTASAATSLLVEKISNVGGALTKAYGKGILDKALANAASRIPARMLKAGLGEGFEEILEAILDPLWQRLIYDKTASLDAQEILYQGLIGAILGWLAGGIGNVDTSDPKAAAEQLNKFADALAAESAVLNPDTATAEQVEAQKKSLLEIMQSQWQPQQSSLLDTMRLTYQTGTMNPLLRQSRAEWQGIPKPAASTTTQGPIFKNVPGQAAQQPLASPQEAPQAAQPTPSPIQTQETPAATQAKQGGIVFAPGTPGAAITAQKDTGATQRDNGVSPAAAGSHDSMVTPVNNQNIATIEGEVKGFVDEKLGTKEGLSAKEFVAEISSRYEKNPNPEYMADRKSVV
jgi:hypothetical protein